MSNSDGMTSAMASQGTNKVVEFEGGHFSFAFGNEIAMVMDGEFFILNCTYELWTEVKEKVGSCKSKLELIDFWLEKSKDYECSDWSGDFDTIKD